LAEDCGPARTVAGVRGPERDPRWDTRSGAETFTIERGKGVEEKVGSTGKGVAGEEDS